MFFCDNSETKKGPRPIGFLDYDAPACALFVARQKNAGPPASTVIIIEAPPKAAEEDRLAKWERSVVRVAVLIATILGLLSWLLSHGSPSLLAEAKTTLTSFLGL